MTDELDDLFHRAALAAYLEEAQACQGWPGREATKRRAYALYEAELAERNAIKPRKDNDHDDTAKKENKGSGSHAHTGSESEKPLTGRHAQACSAHPLVITL